MKFVCVVLLVFMGVILCSTYTEAAPRMDLMKSMLRKTQQASPFFPAKRESTTKEEFLNSLKARRAMNATDLFSLIPGRYPHAVSLPTVLEQIPDGPQGRKFVEDLAESIYKRFGIWVPDFVVDLFFEDSSILLNFLQFSTLELYLGVEALNLAYQQGLINSSVGHVDYLPSGFDLANSQSFPLDLNNYIPGPPTEIAPNLWQGFYPGKAPLSTIKSEIVLSLAFNQLSNNSHLPNGATNRFAVVYNSQRYTAIDDLLNALLANDHTINIYLTWRAVDFFGWLTKDSKGDWKEVPVPVMLDTGVYAGGTQATLPAIHDEIVIEIKSGPNTKGYRFDGNLLWYEGDSAIGFFAGDLYSYASWVGTVNAEYLSGAQAVRYLHMAGVFSDTLLQSAKQFNLYDLGYAATGICVDSVAVIEDVFFNEITLYPLLMQTNLVIPVLQQNYALGNRDAAYYKDLLKAIRDISPDIYNEPSIKQRAYNTISWPPGQEPFMAVVYARSILQS